MTVLPADENWVEGRVKDGKTKESRDTQTSPISSVESIISSVSKIKKANNLKHNC